MRPMIRPSETHRLRTFSILVAVGLGLGASAVWLNYGTFDACSIVRTQVRQEAAREKGPGTALAALVPDSVVDAAVEAKYGELTRGTCIKILLQRQPIL